MAARARIGGYLSWRASRDYKSKCAAYLVPRKSRLIHGLIYIRHLRSFNAAKLAACTFDVDLLPIIRNFIMKNYALVFLFGSHLALSGCATTSSQLGHSAVATQSPQPSQAGADYSTSAESSDAGLTTRGAVETAQDITQTAREAKSTVYEVKRTINELKGLMEGW